MIRLFRHYCATPVLVLFIAETLLLMGVFVVFSLFLDPGFRLGSGALAALLGRALVTAFVIQIMLVMLDLYDPVRIWEAQQRPGALMPARRMVLAGGMGGMVLAAFSWLLPGLAVAGSAMPLGLLVGVGGIMLLRVGSRMEVPSLTDSEDVLVVGPPRQRSRFLAQMVNAPEADKCRFHMAEPGEDLLKKVEVLEPDRVVVGMHKGKPILASSLVRIRISGVPVESFASYVERVCRKVPVGLLSQVELSMGHGLRETVMERVLGRCVDAVVAGGLLLLVSPLLLVVVASIRLTSPGPIFFTQSRVGEGGKVFRLYKFRTMCTQQEGEGGESQRWASRNDSRVTPVGRYLRRFRIDEIPQAINILKGDMSFVGPRPEQPALAEELRLRIPFYSLREVVRPGLTGWAQINMEYAGSIEESREKLTYDLYYIKNHSLFLDLIILFRTAKVVVLGRGAR